MKLINTLITKIFSIVVVLIFGAYSLLALPDYVQQRNPVQHTCIVQAPNCTEKSVCDSILVDFAFRVQSADLLYYTINEQQQAILNYDITIINKENIIVKRYKYIDTVLASQSEYLNRSAYFMKNFRLTLPNTDYSYELFVRQEQNGELYHRRGKIEEFKSLDTQQPVLANQFNGRFYLSIYDSTLDYRSEAMYIIIPINKTASDITHCKIKKLQGTVDIGFELISNLDRKEKVELIQQMIDITNTCEITLSPNENSYYIQIKLDPEVYSPGRYSLSVYGREYSFWVGYIAQPEALRDIKVASQLMKLVMNNTEYNEFKTAPDNDKYSHIAKFFKQYDSNKKTAYNEAMNEFFRRADYAAQFYPDINNNRGYDTPRGKIYTLYGEPSTIEVENLQGRSIEKWIYNKLNKTVEFEIEDNIYYLINY